MIDISVAEELNAMNNCNRFPSHESTSNKPTVSIIIPVYNVAPYLELAIDSVLRQTYRNLDIILIDDASTDGSAEICSKYKDLDERIRIVSKSENAGLSASRNSGINIARGEWIAFLDSDDVYHQNYVSIMLETLTKHDVDMVVCKFMRRDNDDYVDPSSPVLDEGLYLRKEALIAFVEKRINTSVWNKLYRRELWENIRFPVGRVYEDAETTCKLLDKCRSIYVIDDYLYFYRVRSGSINRTLSFNNMKDWIFARKNIESFIVDNIPSVFSDKHLSNAKQLRLEQMIKFYFYLSRNNSCENKRDREELRREIRDVNCSLNACSWNIWICYRLICTFPWAIKVVYSAYRLFRSK